MASITVTKHTTQSACAGQLNHVYRQNKNYSNEDIQTDKEKDNMYIGNAETCRQMIHDTIADIDARKPPQRIRADRKTVAELCVPAPREGMSPEDAKKFIDDFSEELEKYGDCHIVGGAIHGDEIHDYIDPHDNQKHTSRFHGHIFVVPETSKGLNMKSWLTKSRFNKINEIADRVCMRDFGYSYRDGSQQKSRGNVERMKAESALAEAQQIIEQNNALESQKAALEAQIDHLEQKAALEAEKDLKRAHKQLWGEDKGKYIMEPEEYEELREFVTQRKNEPTPQEMKTEAEVLHKQAQEHERQTREHEQAAERARMQQEKELRQQREKVKQQAKKEVEEAFQRTGTLPTVQQRFFNFLKKHLVKAGTWEKLKALFEQHERQTQTEIQQRIDQQIDRDFDGFEREL